LNLKADGEIDFQNDQGGEELHLKIPKTIEEDA